MRQKRIIFNCMGLEIVNRLRNQILAVLMTVSAIPLLIFAILSYSNTVGDIEKSKIGTIKSLSESTVNNLKTQFLAAENIIKGLSSHMDLLILLENFNHNRDLVEQFRINAMQSSFKNMIQESGKFIEAIIVTDAKGNIVMEGSKKGDLYIGKKYFNMNEFDAFSQKTAIHVGSVFNSPNTGKMVVPISKSIRKGPLLGAVTLLYDVEKFLSVFKSYDVQNSGCLLIIDVKGMVLHHSADSRFVYKNIDIEVLDSLQKAKSVKEGILDENFELERGSKAYKVSYNMVEPSSLWFVCSMISKAEFAKPVANYRIFIFITLLFLIGLAAAISVLYARKLNKPLHALLVLMKKIEEGNLEIGEGIKTRLFEYRKLQDGFFSMTKSLKTLIAEMQKASSSVEDKVRQLKMSSENSLNNVGNMLSAVSEISSHLEEHTNSIIDACKDMDGLSKEINNAGSVSEDISIFAEDIGHMVEKGNSLVLSLARKSENNLKHTENAVVELASLVEYMKRVGNISKTIVHISKQVNLLALNAFIEAEKAGSTGSGFSVVASSIKKLAEQTKSESEGITKLVSDVSKYSQNLEGIMQSLFATACEQNIAVENFKQTFDKIYSNVIDIKDKIRCISLGLASVLETKDHMLELMQGIKYFSEDIMKVSKTVSSVGNEQFEMVSEVHEIADKLHELANYLSDSVNYFDIK